MSFNFISFNKYFQRFTVIVGSIFINSSILAKDLGAINDTELVSLSGVSNLGPNYNITGFFINNNYYGSVGRGVGGGGTDCCIGIPKKWNPNMKVVVQWTVNIWGKSLPPSAVGKRDPENVAGVYIATVPVEKYENASTLYVHFFHGGKARVVSSEFGALSSKHPILLGDARAVDIATSSIKKPTLKNEE